jgi:hypothetical protein
MAATRGNRTWISVLLLASVVVAPGAVLAQAAREPSPGAEGAGPPRVARGETYDGRRPPAPAPAWTIVPRTLLFVPRALLSLGVRAVAAGLDWAEQSGLAPVVRRVAWAWDGRLRIQPVFGWDQGTTPVAGARLATDLLLGPGRRAVLVAEGAAGAPDVWRVRLRLDPLADPLPGRTRIPGGRAVTLGVEAAFERRDDRPVFGVGYLRRPLDGAAVPVARLASDVLTADVAVGVRAGRHVRLGLRLGADWRRVDEGRRGLAVLRAADLVDATGPGFGDGLAAFAAELTAAFGPVPGPVVPRPGLAARGSARFLVGAGPASRFAALAGEASAFADLGGGERLLGARARASGVLGLGGRAVPLPYLPTLGGALTMRGFAPGRFLGDGVASLSAEYHAEVHRRVWLGLFVDWGGAFLRDDPVPALRRIDVSGGASLAWRLAPGSWWRLQVAGSRDGAQVSLGWEGAP